MGHYYCAATGEPRHFVTAKNGNSRPTTIRDARKHGWVPSVTEILNVIAKPQLENWKVDQGILAALTLPKRDDESERDYIARIKRDSQQQAKEAAEEGSRVHAAIEAHFKGEPYDAKYRPHVDGVLAELARLFPEVDDWVAEKTFAAPEGFGGCCDLHSPSHMVVVDFKGKDGDFTDGKKLAYDQNCQLAAYSAGLLRDTPRRAANLFFSRSHPGKVASHEWEPGDMGRGIDVFMAALGLWKAIKS